MRKLTAVVFALLIATSAIAAPNDSSERRERGPVTRIVRAIKSIVRALDLGHPDEPIPAPPTPTP